MSHQHFCQIEGHYWECNGKALRPGHTETSICICVPCGLPLEGFDHNKCVGRIELLACPDHRGEWLRKTEAAREEFNRRAAEFGLDEKWEKMKSLPEGPEQDALALEITEWLFSDGDDQKPKA